ncbi:MAG: type IV pilus assembly protein PilV [Methylococcaceae bacterium NSP1-2]|nr:type IV pilus modification protein PilV [Methylococcaceae bacterium]OYV16869.1 MAG: type IV pilus assembly protein PilV [Methylococcaceae bacterium NSP1-2]
MKTHTGFTLIEVLIAMLILAVGLLGLAALQTYTLRSNLAAYNNGQAIQLLYDMSDRMRANNCKEVTGTGTGTVTCPNPANYIIGDSNTDNRTAGKNVDSPVHACKITTNSTCNATLLSTYDLIEWNNAIAATLPMGRGCITSGNGVFNLYITWDDNRDGTVTTDVAVPTNCAGTFSTLSSGTSNDPVFTMSTQL